AAAAVSQTQNCTIVLGGDIMLNQIPVKLKPLSALRPLFESGDVGIANLEIPLTNSTRATPFKSAAELRARTQYILKADPQHVLGIKGSGIDMVSLANNHVMDYGVDGLNQMTALLTKHNIPYTGAGPTISEAKEVVSKYPVALLSALAFMNTGSMTKLVPATAKKPGLHALIFNATINKKNREYLTNWISGQRDGEEIMIVALHWGIERMTVPTPYQVNLARACIDAGADVVWGHHPHVLQGAELYKGKPILYSMGNLISKKEGPTGLVRLYYEDFKLKKFRFLPLQIAGMRVKPVPTKSEQARMAAFKSLSQAIQKRYPNKQSKALF
ncbi:MAG: CapA family protein, partial [Chlorobia bacterium]|nr:CapA family protein [Fimbriimonadaceae bacterium]